MGLVLTASNELIYRDMLASLSGEPKKIFSTIDENSDIKAINIREFSPSSSSGFMNSWVNYGYTSIEDTLVGETIAHSGISLKTDAGLPVINADVSSSMQSTRKDYVPQDCGNCHPKYWSSYNNNIRMLGLFSQKVVFLVDTQTDLRPLDCIQLNLYNGATGKSLSYSGKYIIGAKKRVIKGTKYAELFEVYRPTVPKQGTTNLVSDEASVGNKKSTLAPIDVDTTTLANSSNGATTKVLAPENTVVSASSIPALNSNQQQQTTANSGNTFNVAVSAGTNPNSN